MNSRDTYNSSSSMTICLYGLQERLPLILVNIFLKDLPEYYYIPLRTMKAYSTTWTRYLSKCLLSFCVNKSKVSIGCILYSMLMVRYFIKWLTEPLTYSLYTLIVAFFLNGTYLCPN